MFSIEFTEEPVEYPYDDTKVAAAPGVLVMGEVKEGLLASLELWDKSEYEAHWKRQLTSIVEGNKKAALITSYNDPKNSPNMEIWPCYRDGELVRIQNHLPWYDSFPSEFVILELNQFLQEREEFNEGGRRLSEWVVAVQDIDSFLRRSAMR